MEEGIWVREVVEGGPMAGGGRFHGPLPAASCSGGVGDAGDEEVWNTLHFVCREGAGGKFYSHEEIWGTHKKLPCGHLHIWLILV